MESSLFFKHSNPNWFIMIKTRWAGNDTHVHQMAAATLCGKLVGSSLSHCEQSFRKYFCSHFVSFIATLTWYDADNICIFWNLPCILLLSCIIFSFSLFVYGFLQSYFATIMKSTRNKYHLNWLNNGIIQYNTMVLWCI